LHGGDQDNLQLSRPRDKSTIAPVSRLPWYFACSGRALVPFCVQMSSMDKSIQRKIEQLMAASNAPGLSFPGSSTSASSQLFSAPVSLVDDVAVVNETGSPLFANLILYQCFQPGFCGTSEGSARACQGFRRNG